MSEAFKDFLRLNQAAAIATLRAGLPLTKNPEALTDDQWRQLGGELMAAMLELVTAGTSIRRLPRTTACVCPACKKLTLPSGPLHDVYSHCGRVWWPGPKHLGLPEGFWDKARPGDTYEGAVEALWATEEEEHGGQDQKHRRGARSAGKKAG
jgi:hypothetical protein